MSGVPCKAACGNEGTIGINLPSGKKVKVCPACYDKAMKESKWEFLTDPPPATPTTT